jgi:hypothetical protein
MTSETHLVTAKAICKAEFFGEIRPSARQRNGPILDRQHHEPNLAGLARAHRQLGCLRACWPTGTAPCKPVFRSGIRCKPQSRNFVANRTDRNGQASGFAAQLSVGQIASEIRLGRPRRIGIFPRVPLEVFSTNHFRPAVRILHIRHGCCPRRREDICILDSELELQVFT